MARPQTYIRGLHRAGSYMVTGDGIFFTPYSTTVAAIDSDTTGIVLAGGVKVSNQANGLIVANSTAVNLKALTINGSAVYVTRNSTGYKIGARYISTNTTGNLTT